MKKTMKKLATVGIVTALAATSLTGAFADLADLPAPFVENGEADFKVVFGANAATADVAGAVDIAVQLAQKSVTTTSVNLPGTGTSRSISDGASLGTSGDHVLLFETMQANEASFDDDDFPVLLADGVVLEEDDNDDFEYSQKIIPSANVSVKFLEDIDGNPETDPIVHLSMDGTGDDSLWTYKVEFNGGNLNITALGDSETIEMLGKSYTFESDNVLGDEIVLFGADTTTFLDLNAPQTITSEGKSYEIEVVGGSESNANVIISVNGQRKTVVQGDSTTINGLEVYIDEVFVTDIPTLSASAEVFVGSLKIELPAATTMCGATNFTTVQLLDDDIQGVEACVMGADNGDVEEMVFRYIPTELQNDVDGFDATEFLGVGESITDPLFGAFQVLFSGPNFEVDDSQKAMVKFQGGADDFDLTFENDDGDMIKFSPYQYDNDDANVTTYFDNEAEGWNGVVAAGNNIAEDQIFALNEGSGEILTTLFEVSTFTSSGGIDKVKLKNLATGNSDEYKVNDDVVDNARVTAINTVAKTFTLDVSTDYIFYLKGGKNTLTMDFDDNVTAEEPTKSIVLSELDDDEAALNVFTFSVSADATDDEIDVDLTTVSGTPGTDYITEADDGSDVEYTLSQYGTFISADVDESTSATAYVPQDGDAEVYYDVFFAPTDASVVSGGSSGSVNTQTVNPISVGLAVLDTEVDMATVNTNLIVVGGPCANSVAAELLGNPENCIEGFDPGMARIELFDDKLDSGKVAMLVAGAQALETQAASRVVATMDSRLSGTSASLTVTSLNNVQVSTN